MSPAGAGAAWTRTGRPFFAGPAGEHLTDQVRAAAEKAGLFDELGTSWLLLDAEILPWNVKAGSLLRDQYAAVGAAALAALPAAAAALAQASTRDLPGIGDLLDRTQARLANAEAFTAAYARYCWATDELAGVRVAPFQLLATEGAVYAEQPHRWHLALADRLAAADPELFTVTRRVEVDTGDPASVAAATRWWEDLTAAGGEGMVVKPAANLTRGPSGLAQPGLKVRGREYLRIIYGPDYAEPGQPGPAAPARPVPQALAGAARVRPRPRSPGPGGPWRAAVAGARMRLRRPRPGVRARRPPPVTKRN